MTDNLLGKTIVVTGSNGLIEKELVRNLIELNCNIISLDISFKREELKKR